MNTEESVVVAVATWLIAILAAALLFGACAGRDVPHLEPFERAAGVAAQQAWRDAGMPVPADRCKIDRFSVRLADGAESFQRCKSLTNAACLNWESSGHWFRPYRYPVVVITPRWRSEPGIIIHELMHALVDCSGIGPDGAGDHAHSLPAVWIGAGGALPVEASARALVAM